MLAASCNDAARPVPKTSLPDPRPRIVFDLTTSARWRGPAGGIVRVQREIGRLAPEVVTLAVEYSLYDLRRKAFFRVRPELVEDILQGRIVVTFPGALPTSAPGVGDRLRWILRHPRRFLNGRLGRESRLRTKAGEHANGASADGTRPFDAAVDGRLELDRSHVLVSCGADWSGKDLEAIRSAKERDRFRYVSVCYDVIPWRFPGFWPPGVAETVIAYYAALAGLADLVLCISRTTADDYAALCEELAISCPPLAVFRLVDSKPRMDSVPVGLPAELERGRFVLCVGSLEPRKNHRLLYDAWDELARDASFPRDVKLVLVAGARWMTDDLIADIDANPDVRDRIVIVDNASEEELHALYAACLFTVYPSFYEGWGLPVAESLSHGKVCLASDRGSIAEISELAVLIDPYDVDAWRRAIHRHVTDDVRRRALEASIRETFVRTPWEESARRFFEAVLPVHAP